MSSNLFKIIFNINLLIDNQNKILFNYFIIMIYYSKFEEIEIYQIQF
jgi:hypothetical protein